MTQENTQLRFGQKIHFVAVGAIESLMGGVKLETEAQCKKVGADTMNVVMAPVAGISSFVADIFDGGKR